MEGAPRTPEGDRIIMQLAETLRISPVQALVTFYGTETSRMLHDSATGLYLMGDKYILDNLLIEN